MRGIGSMTGKEKQIAAKTYLKQLQKDEAKITRLHEAIEVLRYRASKPHTPDMTGPRVKTSRSRDALGDMLAAIADMALKHDEIALQYEGSRDRITDQILALDCTVRPEMITLLYEHYVNGKTIEAVARALHYTVPHCFTLQGQALELFYDTHLAPAPDRIPESPLTLDNLCKAYGVSKGDTAALRQAVTAGKTADPSTPGAGA